MLQVCVVAAVPAIEQQSPTKPHHHRSLWKRAFLLSASQQQQQRHIDQGTNTHTRQLSFSLLVCLCFDGGFNMIFQFIFSVCEIRAMETSFLFRQ